jgi:hypothetical protein
MSPQRYTCPRCGRSTSAADDIANRYCGACHVFAADLMRMRLYIAGKLEAEEWAANGDEAGKIALSHAAACQDAGRRGDRWMIEIHDPDSPPGVGYVRFGTDSAGMVDPFPLKSWPWSS